MFIAERLTVSQTSGDITMRIITALTIAMALTLGAGIAPSVSEPNPGISGNLLKPAPYLKIDDVYDFPDTTLMCTDEKEFRTLIDAVKRLANSQRVFDSLKTCDLFPKLEATTPRVRTSKLVEVLAEVKTHKGKRYVMMRAVTVDDQAPMTLYVALPALWFIPPEKRTADDYEAVP